jgi:KDO2-lipid IV(A) lauroyltransferase
MSAGRKGFKLRRWAPVQLLLYLVLRAVIMVVHMFPYEKAPGVARTLGHLLRFIDRKHARIALKNIAASREHLATGDPERFIRRVYRHIALGFVEMLMIPRLMQRHALERYVKLEGFEALKGLLAPGRGVIATVGHLGNWELIGLATTLAGWPLNSLARPIENPWVDRYLNRFRTSTGQEIISKYNAVGAMIRSLQRNEILVVQIDQDARHAGVYVKFFGRPASTHKSPAVLSLKYGAPIVPVNIYREKGRHHAVLGEALRPEDFRGHPDPVKALTQAYTAQFETYVRAHPDQWFWLHDRWKTAERVARVDAGAVV